MEPIYLMAKIAFTMVVMPWFFVNICKFLDFNPNDWVKWLVISVFLIGLVFGIISVCCWVWAL